ncbi:MAG: hypothetical protein IKC22_03990 [Bacilli bacterium]|nr:hypothetical protein [Bacilli bacterium]
MNIMFSELKDLKLKLVESNIILIENYHTIKEVNDSLIEIDKYQIKGNSISIVFLNSYKIILRGSFETIQIS